VIVAVAAKTVCEPAATGALRDAVRGCAVTMLLMLRSRPATVVSVLNGVTASTAEQAEINANRRFGHRALDSVNPGWRRPG
jgi:hypothetical protein